MACVEGTLDIVAGDSFLDPDDGSAQLQLVMRNTPPGGSFAQRAAAATAFLTEVVGANKGDAISVTGDPSGSDVFLVDSAQTRQP